MYAHIYIYICIYIHVSISVCAGRVMIQRFKELPTGVNNPAKQATVKMRSGDFIIGINGVRFRTFAECVSAMRSCEGAVLIELERTKKG